LTTKDLTGIQSLAELEKTQEKDSEFSSPEFSSTEFTSDEGASEDPFIVNETPVAPIEEFESLESLAPAPESASESDSILTEESQASFSVTDESDFSGSLTPEPEPGPELEPVLSAEVTAEASALSKAEALPSEKTTLEKIKEYSETLPIGKPVVAASFPFSLLIEGPLRPSERDRLLDLLAQENMGIREVDLEPQLESGKILIPRISEYAGILIVQALRSTQARMSLLPSDWGKQSFSTTQEASPSAAGSSPKTEEKEAETLPITQGDSFPQWPQFKVLETISVSLPLESYELQTESSEAYQTTFELLQRELRYKAFRKGASGVIHFQVMLTPLGLPSQFRLVLVGTAIAAQKTI
jgi:hypothetical protein